VQTNDRVRYVGPLKTLQGQLAVVVDSSVLADPTLVTVMFEGTNNKRVVSHNNLELEKKSVSNFKRNIAAILAGVIQAISTESAKDQAARRYGIAAQLASFGEAEKKKAKNALKGLGILADSYPVGSQMIYDSNTYTITADTSAPSSRLDGTALAAALTKEKLPLAQVRRIVAAATIPTKAATSLKVVQK
jgi:hypothetical protein